MLTISLSNVTIIYLFFNNIILALSFMSPIITSLKFLPDFTDKELKRLNNLTKLSHLVNQKLWFESGFDSKSYDVKTLCFNVGGSSQPEKRILGKVAETWSLYQTGKDLMYHVYHNCIFWSLEFHSWMWIISGLWWQISLLPDFWVASNICFLVS